MEQQPFSASDINDELCRYANLYLKTVISNAKRHYYNQLLKKQKYGLIFIDIDLLSDELGYDDIGYEEALCHFIEIRGIRIPIYNQNLAIALSTLTPAQCSILLEDVVLGYTHKEIAKEWNISERMVRKHKHNGIEILQRRLKNNEDRYI